MNILLAANKSGDWCKCAFRTWTGKVPLQLEISSTGCKYAKTAGNFSTIARVEGNAKKAVSDLLNCGKANHTNGVFLFSFASNFVRGSYHMAFLLTALCF